MPFQWHHRSHFVSFVIYSSGAKFEDYHSNVSRDILDSVFYNCSLLRVQFSNLHITKTLISLKQRKIFQKQKRHSSPLGEAFQISSNYFSFHRHFQ